MKLQDRLDEDRAERDAALLRQRQAAARGQQQQPPPPNAQQAPRPPSMIELAQLARKYRDDFNKGWNIIKDVGIMNEAVAAEIEVLHMLRKSGGVIRSWDAMLEVIRPVLLY